jgi:Domain of unknown function (DUF5679)
MTTPTTVTITAYCMRCRSPKEIHDAEAITMKNGRAAARGICPTCGTKVFKLGAPKP